jgi:two-component system, chemotaxis family, sensor kinase CheA
LERACLTWWAPRATDAAADGMAHDELTARLRATFIEELDEQVRELNSGLLALEQHPRDGDIIRSLFRAAHTIKGAARVAGVPAVEETCHALESLFAAIRDERLSLDGGHFSLLFAVVDGLADAGARLRRGEDVADGALPALLKRLQRELPEATSTPPRAAPPAQPTPAQPPARQSEGATAEPVSVRAEAGEELVRVRADRLDALLSAVGELIVATARVAGRAGPQNDDSRRLAHSTSQVAEVVRHLRLRPFADVCEALPRVVRDVAASGGKDVELQLEGQDVEADRHVVDALRDPLLHLVRNAVDHGIETPDERERAGKPRTGRVRVAAELAGGRLIVTVSDDGSGVDERALAEAAAARGLRTPRTRDELVEVLLAGGISSRREATQISGRGVGIDVVSSAMERIGGTIHVSWNAGAGTVFTLECPPSTATIRAVLFGLSGHIFALPTTQIERLRRLEPDRVLRVEGRAVLQTGRGPVPLHMLAALLGPPLEARSLDAGAPVIEVGAAGRRAGLVVDEVLSEEELVVRPLDIDDGAVPFAMGAAILPTGRIALVLGAAAILAAGARPGTAIAPEPSSRSDAPRRRILVADDSITTRTLEQSVLEAAGYEVNTAVNGEDAWRQLDEQGADLLVADVEMPRMDGIALCRRIRSTERFRELPIVLVTGLASDEDRARGLNAGADAYIVKSSFEQADLLQTVQQLIGEE